MMETWLSYELSDFLLFTPATYFRLYELNNADFWPSQLVILAIAIALVLLNRKQATRSNAVTTWFIAILWGLVSWFFLYQRYAQINLAAEWFATAFAVEALFLFITGFVISKRQPNYPKWQNNSTWNPGLLLFIYALLIHPLIGPLFGRSWESVELFGLAPDPTALGTIGLLLMWNITASKLLMLIPLAWCLFSGLTYLAMEIHYGLITPAMAIMGITASFYSTQPRNTFR